MEYDWMGVEERSVMRGWDRMGGEECHERIGCDERRGVSREDGMGWKERSVMIGWDRRRRVKSEVS